MFFLFLSVICSVTIANLLNIFSRKEKNSLLTVLLGNYLVASLFSLSINSFRLELIFDFVFLLGTITGFLFVFGLILFNLNIKKNGISLSVSFMRASVVIPTVLSLIIFSEFITFINLIGIILVLTTIFLLYNNDFNIRNIIVLLSLFIVSGFTEFNLKVFESLSTGRDGSFIFFIFFSAFCFNFILIKIKKEKIYIKSLCWGFVLGVPNQLSTFFFLKSLASLKASIAYPLAASLIVIFSVLTDFLFWGYKFNLRKTIILSLMLAAVVFLRV